MRRFTSIAWMISIVLLTLPLVTHAAIRKENLSISHPAEGQVHQKIKSEKRLDKWAEKMAKIESKLEKKSGKKSGWFANLLNFPVKWAKKKLYQQERSDASRYLLLTGILLLAAILFFALGGITTVFNYFGSISAIAAAIFFVLWLVAFTKP